MTPFHENSVATEGATAKIIWRKMSGISIHKCTKIKEKSNFTVVGALQISTYMIKSGLTIDIHKFLWIGLFDEKSADSRSILIA